MRKVADFRVFEGKCAIRNGEEEHSLACDTDGEHYWEYCTICGKAWFLTKEQAQEIWGIGGDTNE